MVTFGLVVGRASYGGVSQAAGRCIGHRPGREYVFQYRPWLECLTSLLNVAHRYCDYT